MASGDSDIEAVEVVARPNAFGMLPRSKRPIHPARKRRRQSIVAIAAGGGVDVEVEVAGEDGADLGLADKTAVVGDCVAGGEARSRSDAFGDGAGPATSTRIYNFTHGFCTM